MIMTESVRPQVNVQVRTAPPVADLAAKHTTLIECQKLSLWYGQSQALRDISFLIREKLVTAFIGPSGCGKSTLLRCFNRMNDLIDHVRITGEITIAGQNIYDRQVDVIELRKRVGMVFQRSNPFPKSIYDNIVYALRLHGVSRKSDLDSIVEESLRRAALWD
jgi:phosphate transport system ATP-binding protein